MLATSMPARTLTGFRRTSSISSQLPTYLEQFGARNNRIRDFGCQAE